MTTPKRYSQVIFLASAFALPPKILDVDWSLNVRNQSRAPERKAKAVELLSRTLTEAKDPLPVLRFEFREGIFQINGKQLAFISREQKNLNLWSIPVGFEAIKWEKSSARTGLVGWEIYPSKVFLLDWGEKNTGAKAMGYRIDWSEDSELLRFFECRYGRWALVENLPNGLTRIYFIEKNTDSTLSIKNQTVFDFNPQGHSSEVFKVENEGCDTFWFSGTFGKVRVRY